MLERRITEKLINLKKNLQSTQSQVPNHPVNEEFLKESQNCQVYVDDFIPNLMIKAEET